MSNFVITDFKADYAATDRSTCTRCRQSIGKGLFRMGPVVQASKGDYKFPSWMHVACFEDGWLPKNPNILTSVSQVAGMDKLRFEDQKKVKGLVVGGDSTLETKATTAEEKRLAADSKSIFAKKAKLEELTNRELQELLEYNKQPNSGKIFGGTGNMIDRAAEAMVFGALAKCPNCKDGDLRVNHGEYKCTGNMDEYAKCEYSTEDPTRNGFKVPKALAGHYSFLKNFTFKARDKTSGAIEGKNPNVTKNPTAEGEAAVVGAKRKRNDGDSDAEAEDERAGTEGANLDNTPFFGCVILFCGKLSKTQVVLKKTVVDHGGSVATTVNGANFCVCTKEEAAGSGSQKGKDALKAKLTMVGEEWMNDCITQEKRIRGEDLEPYVLANPKTTDAERDNRARVAAKLELQRKAQEERELITEKNTTEGGGGGGKSAAAGNTVPGKSTHKKLVIKGSAAVDFDSDLVDEGHIYEPSKDEVFNATLNLSDVSTGQNSMYVLQIIEHDNKKRWTVFRKWGKVGNDAIGDKKITTYPSIASAVAEFTKVFKDKTGNPWSDRKPDKFKKKYNFFAPVEVDYEADDSDGDGGMSDAQLKVDASYKGKLDRPTQELVTLLFDIQAMKDTLKEMEIDMEKMPLGKISKTSIQDAFGLLKKLQSLLDSVDGDFTDLPLTSKDYTSCVSLSNQFYTKIPHAAEAGKKLPLLNDLKLIEEKGTLLTTLQDLEVASKMLSKSKGDDDDDQEEKVHPIDVHYDKLKTKFDTVAKGSDHFKMINKYLTDTHASTHKMYDLELVDLWEVDRQGEEARFAPWANDKNRQLLWHGSRLTNWCGILSQGLRIAPPEAPTTGYMFGKGVYFADMSSKSANYCFTSSDKTTGVMMLAEVAMGDMYELKHASYVDGLKKPYISTKGVGKNQPDPKSKIVMDNGTVIPTGKGTDSGVKDTTLMYNEFIVYDVSQIRIRYVLRLNFNYKGKYGTFH